MRHHLDAPEQATLKSSDGCIEAGSWNVGEAPLPQLPPLIGRLT